MIRNSKKQFLKRVGRVFYKLLFTFSSIYFVDVCYGNEGQLKTVEGIVANDDNGSDGSSDPLDIVSKIKTNVKELKSRRGIRIFYMRDSNSPIVHVRIAFKNSGAAYQVKEKTGVAAFYAKSVFQGCGKYSPAAFSKAVSDLASRISCDCNMDITTFSLTTPKVVLNEAVKLLNLALVDPKFEEDKIKIIKDSFLGFLQDYSSDPRGMATKQIIPAIIFKGHQYEKGGLGSPEDFARLSVDDLRRFKDVYVVAKNAMICVFGDVSEEEAVALVDRVFEGVGDGSRAPDSIPDVSPKLEQMQKKYYTSGPQSAVLFVLKCARPGSKEAAVSTIVSTVLGGPILTKSKVLGILRGKLGYIYTGRVSEQHLQHSNALVGVLLTDNSKVASAINALKKIIKNLRENGITREELDFAKGFINGSTLVGLRTSGRLCDFYFSEILKGAGVEALQKFLKKINQVTLEDVLEYCKKVFDEHSIPFVVIGGNAGIERQENAAIVGEKNQVSREMQRQAEGSAK